MKPEDIKPWRIKESTYLVKRPWLTARRDVVELPDGRTIPEYYVLEYPDWVNVIAITRDGKFIMEKQYRHGMQCMSYELPCGVMEKGETPLEAAQRELLEETGYGKGTWTPIIDIAQNPGSMSNMTHCFLATDVEPIGEQHLDATEDLAVFFASRAEVMEMLQDGRIFQALMVAPLYKYFFNELIC